MRVFRELQRHCTALSEDGYWEDDSLGDIDLEADMRAAAFVIHGGTLQKWRKHGREKPHRRFVRISCTGGGSSLSAPRPQSVLRWDHKSDYVIRADNEVYESCFQGETAANVSSNAFQIILAKRMLFMVADSADERAAWVRGINAIASNNITRLQRDDERLGADVPDAAESMNWVAVHHRLSGAIYLRDFAAGAQHWFRPSRAGRLDFSDATGHRDANADSKWTSERTPPPPLPPSTNHKIVGEAARMQPSGGHHMEFPPNDCAADELYSKHNEERAAQEEAFGIARTLVDATDAIQQSLLTQDARAVRAAIACFGHVLDGGNDQSRADLEVAKMYLVELEQAAAAAAAEYNAAVGQLHRMIYAQLDGPREAGKALQQLKAAAARAEALGAPAEIIDAAQEKATTLHLAHVELLQTQALAEAQLADATRALLSFGLVAVETLRTAHSQALSIGLQGAVVDQAAAALQAAERHEAGRAHEGAAAEAVLRIAMHAVAQSLEEAVLSGEAMRHFETAETLRHAIRCAKEAGVDRALMHEANHQLAPIEAAELRHQNEINMLNEHLHAALAADDDDALKASIENALPLRRFVNADIFDAASKRHEQLIRAHELAESTTDLKAQLESVSGIRGAAALRVAFHRAEAAGLQGLIVRKAAARLKELSQVEEAERREADALAWMRRKEKWRAKGEQRHDEHIAKVTAVKGCRAADDDLVDLMIGCAGWEAHNAPDGREYYHNKVTSVTTWQRPTQLEIVPYHISANSGERSTNADMRTMHMRSARMVARMNSSVLDAHCIRHASLEELSREKLEKFLNARDVDHDEGLDRHTLIELAIAWAHLPKVIWRRAKTSDGRLYWFNANTKATSWKQPVVSDAL